MAEKQDTTKEMKNNDKTLSHRKDCISTVGPNLFMLIVQRRAQGKTRTKRSRNVKGIQKARAKRNQFLAYLTENDRELEHRKLTRAGAKAAGALFSSLKKVELNQEIIIKDKNEVGA